MDSDDDDNEDEEQSDRDASPASEPEPEQQEETQPTVARTDERAAARVRIAPVAHVADDELRIWGPDGPVDRGDDTLFRTVGEWMNTVAPIVSSRPSPCRRGSVLQSNSADSPLDAFISIFFLFRTAAFLRPRLKLAATSTCLLCPSAAHTMSACIRTTLATASPHLASVTSSLPSTTLRQNGCK